MEFFKKLIVIFFISFMLIACGNPVAQTEVTITETPLIPATPSKTPFPTLPRQPTFTVGPTKTPTLTPTLNPTQQTWLSTAIAIGATQKIITQHARATIETEISQFIIECEGVTQNAQGGSLSTNKQWLATWCGNQNLHIQNIEGTKRWVLEFEDFLHPSFQSQGTPGRVYPVFWDADDSYLYFSTGIGWSGGGDECFSWHVRTGLFRLNLKNGTWVTLVNPSEYFPGDHIEVSPTGRRYVSDINGVLITDVYTGKVIQINAKGVMAFRWSPDGTKLAYSTSSCNEEGFVIDSSVSVWDAITNEVRTIFTTETEVLTPIQWDDNSVLRFEGEKYIDRDVIFTLYVFDITKDEILFIGSTSLLP